MDKLNQIEQKLDACVAGTGSLGVYDGNNVFLGYLVGAPASSIQVFDPIIQASYYIIELRTNNGTSFFPVL